METSRIVLLKADMLTAIRMYWADVQKWKANGPNELCVFLSNIYNTAEIMGADEDIHFVLNYNKARKGKKRCTPLSKLPPMCP